MNTLAPVLVLTTPFFVLQAAEGVDFHVAPDGSDDQPGSKSEPFATLERARDEIRKRKQQGSLAGPVTVLVRGGTYHFAKSLELDVRDSGTPAAPIVWRAATDQEVRLSGGADASTGHLSSRRRPRRLAAVEDVSSQQRVSG